MKTDSTGRDLGTSSFQRHSEASLAQLRPRTWAAYRAPQPIRHAQASGNTFALQLDRQHTRLDNLSISR